MLAASREALSSIARVPYDARTQALYDATEHLAKCVGESHKHAITRIHALFDYVPPTPNVQHESHESSAYRPERDAKQVLAQIAMKVEFAMEDTSRVLQSLPPLPTGCPNMRKKCELADYTTLFTQKQLSEDELIHVHVYSGSDQCWCIVPPLHHKSFALSKKHWRMGARRRFRRQLYATEQQCMACAKSKRLCLMDVYGDYTFSCGSWKSGTFVHNCIHDIVGIRLKLAGVSGVKYE